MNVRSRIGRPNGRVHALLVGLLAGSLAACASLPAKKGAANTLTETERLLGAARDAERTLCSSTADKTKPVTRCDGAAAPAAGLTEVRQQEAEKAFAAAFDAYAKASAAMEAWNRGDPPPAALHELGVTVEAALLVFHGLNNNPAVTIIADSLQQAIDNVASIQAALTVG